MKLKVAKSMDDNAEKSIVQLDSEICQKLRMKKGDILRIKGKKKVTAAVVESIDAEDDSENLIRMNALTRENADVVVGDIIVIKKITPKWAKEIVIVPSKVEIPDFDSSFEAIIRRRLLNYPLNIGDKLFIPIDVLGKVEFEVKFTDPTGIVVITNDTVISFGKDSKEETPDLYIYGDENGESKVIEVKVAEAKQRDVGRSIIRLDSDTFKQLKIRTGDIIRIEGKNRVTAAIVWPAYKEDQRRGIIRMDGRIRKNAGVSIGERISIQKAAENTAREIILAPTNVRMTSGDPYVESFIKRKLLNYPLTQGDVIYIPIGIAREVPFQIVSTKPRGVVVVKKITILKVSEHPEEELKSGIPYVSYQDIGGLKKEIQQIREIIELPLIHPELFKKLGIDPPKGILLHGPSGCGKTLLVKAVANETEAYFKSINGPEIMSKFYGESEKRLRAIFDDAEKRAPSIIFIDHIDSIISGAIDKEYELGVLSQLLALMDGLKGRRRVIVIGATNRLFAINPAFRRPGRFDREIEIGIPNTQGRKEILQIHTKTIPLTNDVNIDVLVTRTEGFVGAELAALCREAAMIALRRYQPKINMDNKEVPPDILDQIKVFMEDFDLAEKMIRGNKKIDKTIEYLMKIVSIYKHISFETICMKTGIDFNDLRVLVENLLLKGEIQGEIKEDVLVFKAKEEK